jgi:Heparinase II/III N-terminus/Heparinase II/III-like protein
MNAVYKLRSLSKKLTGRSPRELQVRSWQEISKRADLLRSRLGLQPSRSRTRSDSEFHARFFFSPTDLPGIMNLLAARLPREAAAIVRQAESICRHRFDLLGYERLEYGAEIDWHLDAASGKRAPRRPWYQIRYLDFDEVGDSKVTWELNRHQHLVTLAKAYRLTNNTCYSAEIVGQWRHWQQENPYPIGINWASSLEVAFRSLSWLWVRQLLAGSPDLPESFLAELEHALTVNARHVEKYLSTYFSPNTHLLGEGVALFFVGTLCPEFAASPRWQRKGWQIVLEASRRQVRSDGMHYEQSTYYHVYALDFFLHARILAAVNGVKVPPTFDETLVRMLEFLALLGQAGAVSRLGDDDGGRVFDPRRNRSEHLLDPLSTGAVLFGRRDFKAAVGSLREETLWLLGKQAVADFERLPEAAPECRSGSFRESGIYVLASPFPSPHQLVLDAGPHGGGSAGHGHADALSIHLSGGGREWLADPGTGVYVSPDSERDRFRGTFAHNTLQVDNKEQAEPLTPFQWRQILDSRV